MIISASRRTDIPAFYGTWFRNRLRAGFCEVVHPFRPTRVSVVSLAREDVDAFVFWTRDPRPFASALDDVEAMDIPYYVLFTITGMSKKLEPAVPRRAAQVAAFRELSARVGPGRVIWRFDPILFSELLTPEENLGRFRDIAAALEGTTRRVIISFADFYRKTERRLAAAARDTGDTFVRDPWSLPSTGVFLDALRREAEHRGMEIRCCAEEDPGLLRHGIPPGACIDADLLQREFGLDLSRRKDPAQRAACHCAVARDIGASDSCLHGCVYCYATRSDETAHRRAARHDPWAARLIPEEIPGILPGP